MTDTEATLTIGDNIQMRGNVENFTVDSTSIGPVDNPLSSWSEVTVTFTAAIRVDAEHLLADLLRSEDDRKETVNE